MIPPSVPRDRPELGLVRGLALLVVLGLLACGPPDVPPPSSDSPLEVEVVGCWEMRLPVDDPICVLDEASPHLALWVRTDPGSGDGPGEDRGPTVTAGDRRWDGVDAVAVQQGFRFELENLVADRLHVRVGDAEWTLRLERGPKLEAELADLELEALEARLETASIEEQGHLRLALARKCASHEEAVEHLADAVRAFEATGRRSSTLVALTRLHYTFYFHLDRPDEADRVLADLPAIPRGDARSAYFVDFFRGSWANKQGRFRDALRRLDASARQAERLLPELRHFSEQERAHLLARLGRWSEARETLGRLERAAKDFEQEPATDEARRATLAALYANMGWSRLLMAEAGRTADPVPDLERALEHARALGAAELIRNGELNLALAFLQAGRPARAREHFERMAATEGELPWWIEVWSFDIEARLALAEGRPEQALGLWREMARRPELRSYPDAPWRSAIGQAQALEALGRPEEALAAFGRAEAERRRTSLSVPLDAGRLSSTLAYGRGTELHLDLLLRLGLEDRLLEQVRRSRAHFFHGLQLDSRLETLDGGERSEWARMLHRYRRQQEELHRRVRESESASADRATALRRAVEEAEKELGRILDRALELLDRRGLGSSGGGGMPELPPYDGDGLWLVYHPLGDGWLGLAVDERGIRSARLADPFAEPDRASEILLQPFAEAIRRAERIRILPSDELWSISFEALSFDGSPLLERAPLVYALDLPPAPARVDEGPWRRALLLADPTGSLRHAVREVEGVRAALESAEPGWRVEILPVTSAESTVGTALDRLAEGGDLFHFAGHGDLFAAGRRSGLVFERGFEGTVRLTPTDLLTLPRAPSTVVLSGCETVRPPSPEGPTGLGLGQAFLLAGSRSVVGAMEKVEDRRAGALVRRFYVHWRGPGTEAEALRRAQLELLQEAPDNGDAPAFRVLER